MNIFDKCDKCVGECKHCASARVQYNVGYFKGKYDALEELKERLQTRTKCGNDIYTLAVRHCIEIIEKMEEYEFGTNKL